MTEKKDEIECVYAVIPPDNSEPVEIKRIHRSLKKGQKGFQDLVLKDLQTLVGGYIEQIPAAIGIKDPFIFIGNDNPEKDETTYNERASAGICHRYPLHGPIVLTNNCGM